MADEIFLYGLVGMIAVPFVWHYASIPPEAMLGAGVLIGGILTVGGWIAWAFSLRR